MFLTRGGRLAEDRDAQVPVGSGGARLPDAPDRTAATHAVTAAEVVSAVTEAAAGPAGGAAAGPTPVCWGPAARAAPTTESNAGRSARLGVGGGASALPTVEADQSAGPRAPDPGGANFGLGLPGVVPLLVVETDALVDAVGTIAAALHGDGTLTS